MKMAGAVQSEFGRFIRRTRRLRQILKDTLRTFDEIRTAGNFENDAVPFPQMNEDEVTAVENIVDKPPAIVILGHNNAAKAAVTNAVFKQNILPTVPDYEPNIDCGQSINGTKWRSILFTYSNHTSISLSLPGSFELVEDPEAYDKPWKTIPLSDLAVLSTTDDVQLAAMLDVQFKCSLLKDGGHVIVSTSRQDRTLLQMYKACAETVNPVPVYPVSGSSLTEQEVEQLQELKEEFPHLALFFIKVPRSSITQTTQHRANQPNSEDVINQSVDNNSCMLDYSNNEFFESPMVPSSQTQEEDRSIVIHNENTQNSDAKRHSQIETTNGNGEIPESFTLLRQLVDLGFVNFVPSPENTHRHSASSDTYQVESELIESIQNLKQLGIFTKSVLRGVLLGAANVLNLSHKRCLQSFIMKAFDMTRDIMITPKRIEFAREKESELFRTLIEMSMSKQDEIRELITETICGHRVELLEKAADYEFLGVDIPETKVVSSAKDLKICTGQIQELVLGYLNTAIAAQILSSLNILKETYTGTLTRCLESLEQAENLESTKTSSALKEILNAAYQVDITVRTGSSFVRVLMEKMRQLIYSMPWKPQPRVTAEWKQAVASNIMKSLSAPKLAKSVCNQIKDRLKNSHETFTAALKQLEERHSGRLVKMEELRLRVKKYHAPKVARLALESMSIRDRILYGIPKIAREVGRGQYGVVYACDSWAGFSPCAVKTVVPPDDKHWNDLALEFYYTKLLPEHDRVVNLRGSVIDYSYGESSSQVLLIMDRLQRDLYSALKSGIEWITSLQIAIDVVEGIRFLHNQGLVHRDIKLKNVLLDKENRAKITDLGFCKPEAMMSGSIVGTPIHMAPELFTGNYDNSVDVFAFGVLFWYLCAGHVRLPFTYEQCRSKDMLWDSVKRGVRPERLPQFTDECWNLMQACWSGDPEQRPLLGIVEPQLLDMYKRYSDSGSSSCHKEEKTRSTVGR